MKKTLIALAALAATGATLAQSSVTIYGRMDLGMSSVETTTGAGIAADTTEATSLAGAQGTRTGSRLGFRGTEDLGGGLRASFVYEIGINPDRQTAVRIAPNDTGVLDNAQTRLANLSLSGGFGTVVVGTFMNAFDTARGFSPATTGAAPGGEFTQAHGTALSERFDSRTQNAIAYVSPAFSGFTFSAGTVSEEHTAAGTATAVNNQRKYDGFILGLNYSQGPLAAQFAFGQLDVAFHQGVPAVLGTPLSPTNAEVQNWALGVRYTLAPVVLSFVYEDAEVSTAAGGLQREFNAWEIGARFPMGAFAPYITFGQGEISTTADATTPNGRDNDTSAWQIGTTYNLSTRTWIYAAFGEFQRDRADGANRTKSDGYAIGLVHTF